MHSGKSIQQIIKKNIISYLEIKSLHINPFLFIDSFLLDICPKYGHESGSKFSLIIIS